MGRVEINPPPQIKISTVVSIIDKSQKLRAIHDLSFELLINGFEIMMVNNATRYTTKQEAI